MMTQAVATPDVAPPSTVSGPTDISISLGINNPDDPNFVSLIVPVDQQYVSIHEGFNGTITWNLDGENTVNAFFDNPPISISGDCMMPELVTQSSKTISMNWANDSSPTRGMSFFYTLRVFVVINGARIPLRHDPTVHNDPPTP